MEIERHEYDSHDAAQRRARLERYDARNEFWYWYVGNGMVAVVFGGLGIALAWWWFG